MPDLIKTTKVYVISGNFSEFQSYRSKEAFNRKDTIFFYVPGPEALRGLRDISGVFYGSWKERKDIDDIINILYMVQTDINKINALRKISHVLEYYRLGG